MTRPALCIVPHSRLEVTSPRAFAAACSIIPTLSDLDYRLWNLVSALSVFDELTESAHTLAELLGRSQRSIEISIANLQDHSILSTWGLLSQSRRGYRVLLNLTAWGAMPATAEDLPAPSGHATADVLARQSRVRCHTVRPAAFSRPESEAGLGPRPASVRGRPRRRSEAGLGGVRGRPRTLSYKAEETEEREKETATAAVAKLPDSPPPAPPVSPDPDPDPRTPETCQLTDAWQAARKDVLGITGADPGAEAAMPAIVAYCAGDPVRLAQVCRMFRWVLSHERLKSWAGSIAWVAGRIDQLHPQACGADERVREAKPDAPVDQERRARQAELAPVMDHLKRVLLLADRAGEARAAIDHVRSLPTAEAVAYAQALIREVSARANEVR